MLPDGTPPPGSPRVRRLATGELTPAEIAAIRELMVAAFGDDEENAFTDDDWNHALGGIHVLLEIDGAVVSHASVVEREIHVGERPLRAGYVEAVATAGDRQGAGFGSIVMAAIDGILRQRYEIGVLGTGRHHFYERLGWRRWAGPLFVREPGGPRRTPDDEGYLMVLETPSSPPLDFDAAISCDWRPGDVW